MDANNTLLDALGALPNLVQEMKALKDEVSQLKQTVVSSPENPLSLEEASLLLRKKPNTLYQKCSNGELPHYNRGNLYFFKTELIEWIKTGKILSKVEIDAAADKYLITKK